MAELSIYDMWLKDLRRRVLHNPVTSTIGGLALGGIAIGIVVAIIVFWIQPMSTPELEGTIHYREGRFTLWYQRDSVGVTTHSVLADLLAEEYHQLIDLLDVDSDLVPSPIDVFIHDDITAMRTSIVKRKSPNSCSVYLAPLDLLAGEDPRECLAELVLAFGWGQCGSQILQTGTKLYAVEPGRNFHAVLAALPERFFLSLSELMRIEERGYFPKSVYQQFDSPYALASIAFSNIRSLLALDISGEVLPENIEALEAASFVQFLVETKGGIQALKRAWGKGSSEKLLRRIGPLSPEEIGTEWYAEGVRQGKDDTDFPYLMAYYLLAGGSPDAAWAEAQTWLLDGLSDVELLVGARCALSVGDFSAAGEIATYLDEQEAKNELEQYLVLYQDWNVEETTGLRIFFSPEAMRESGVRSIAEVAGIYARMSARLGLSPSDLPERLTLFLYSDALLRDSGAMLTPLSAIQSGALHLLVTDDIAYCLGEMLPGYAWQKNTYSRLLRIGLAVALSRSEECLAVEGRQLRNEERWFSLPRLDIDMIDRKTAEIEAGLLVNYVLATYGAEDLSQVWILTSPLDCYLSFDMALEEVCQTTRNRIEQCLFSSLLSCGE